MQLEELEINEQSIKTELSAYKDKPYQCLFEYIWNAFDAKATEVKIMFEAPKSGVGYVDNVRVVDNGKGWDFDNRITTKTFLSSAKHDDNSPNRTLPMGKYGRGRYAFIWVAERLEVLSKGKKICLQHDTGITTGHTSSIVQGTEVHFLGINEDFSLKLSAASSLENEILLEFCWFLAENQNYRIWINDKEVDVQKNVKIQKSLCKSDFPEDMRSSLDENFKVDILLWKHKPSEYSKFYFLNENSLEVFKHNTGLNKKGDNFWHSVYIGSTLFKASEDIDEEDESQETLCFDGKNVRKVRKQIIGKVKDELTLLRKPYLVEQSDSVLQELKEDELIPNLQEYGIYDEESYGDLLKTIYIISPSLFVNKSDSEKKFICATFAGLLSTQDNHLIKVILEQLQELTDDEKKDLLDVLNRASLSNVIKTIKEIDHRLEVIDKLKILIFAHEKETLEVKHLQKVLDENFWIFGEQYRLFATTEGALKNTLTKYAKEVLSIENPVLDTEPNGEVDLFLTKTECFSSTQRNTIVEIKRASRYLTKKEYDQIDDYRMKIAEQNLCNGVNQYWEYYLIGKDYDKYIEEKIDGYISYGEKERGLIFRTQDGKAKVYVRKWSDILEVEWGSKMKYLKDRLQIEAKEAANTPSEIVASLRTQL